MAKHGGSLSKAAAKTKRNHVEARRNRHKTTTTKTFTRGAHAYYGKV